MTEEFRSLGMLRNHWRAGGEFDAQWTWGGMAEAISFSVQLVCIRSTSPRTRHDSVSGQTRIDLEFSDDARERLAGVERSRVPTCHPMYAGLRRLFGRGECITPVPTLERQRLCD